MKCAECGGQMVIRAGAVRRYDFGGLPHVELHGIEVATCQKCGYEEVAIPRIEALHRALAVGLISQTRQLIPTEIRFLRKFIGLSSADFAKVMGVTRETVSRWETGAKPMGAPADRLLRLLVATSTPKQHYDAVEVLKEIKADPPGKPQRVGMRVIGNKWRPAGIPAARTE